MVGCHKITFFHFKQGLDGHTSIEVGWVWFCLDEFDVDCFICRVGSSLHLFKTFQSFSVCIVEMIWIYDQFTEVALSGDSCVRRTEESLLLLPGGHFCYWLLAGADSPAESSSAMQPLHILIPPCHPPSSHLFQLLWLHSPEYHILSRKSNSWLSVLRRGVGGDSALQQVFAYIRVSQTTFSDLASAV